MPRYICIHAHCYQPPRENPWLEAVERQDSAYPYHDWNERITAECYAPNEAARILDRQGLIAEIVDNYSKISFNFGPTLLSWMEENDPEVYRCIVLSDQESQKRFSGHGSAIAQAYNHMILPLANPRDKYTQIRWGIADFERRFQRFPEGMWLPETAVDVQTLEMLAEQGIKFTILAPRQAGKVRKLGGRAWKDVSGGRIDPTRAYLARLPSGRRINLFFYDGPISQAVAFEKLLESGEVFAARLESGFSDARGWTQLMHIATDGETYGHHHRYGDMALAYALHAIESKPGLRLTNYGEFLEKFPPTHEVQIIENTAWSCSHGVDRWKSDCGCSSGRAGWNQIWRGPLRAAMDYLRDSIAPLYERHASEFLNNVWEARNDYIEVILDRSPNSLWIFFEKYSRRQLKPEETVATLRLMEMQRHAMLMYTSCGWFFDEVSGIETVQIIQYAARVIQLARRVTGTDLEPEFLKRLAEAKSNIPEMGDGAQVYERWVRHSMVDLRDVAAHFAISSLFEDSKDGAPKFCFDIRIEDYQRLDSGAAKLGLGRIRVTSQITRESSELAFGVIHIGDQVLHAGVRRLKDIPDYAEVTGEITGAFSAGVIPETLRLLDLHFAGLQYSLKSLFKDEQKRILDLILAQTLRDAEASYRAVYERHGPLLRFLKEMEQPLPDVLRVTAEFVLNSDLKHTLETDPVDSVRIAMLMELVKREGVTLEEAGLSYAATRSMKRLMQRLEQEPRNMELLERANVLVTLLQMFPFQVNYWKAQNIFYSMLKNVFPFIAKGTDEASQMWTRRFLELGERLKVRGPEEETPAELRRAS
jgi:alpha-amylase/alpha-mannosidase (GH57 family)